MPPYITPLIIALLIWRLLAFVAAYRRAKFSAAEREAERAQEKDWARRMQGPGKDGK